MSQLLLTLGALALSPFESTGGEHGHGAEHHEEKTGAVDKRANGTPAKGRVDEEAVGRLGEAERLLRDDDREAECIAVARPLLKVFEQNEDFDHLVDCLFLIGEAYFYMNDWERAEQYMSRAAELGYRYFADEMSSYPLKVVGESQFEQKKPEAALATFRERVQILRKQNDMDELPGALFDVGGMLINLGQFDEAIAMLSDAKQSNEQRLKQLEDEGEDTEGAQVDQGEITYHIAIAYFQQGDMHTARGWLEQALTAFEAVGEEMQDEVSDRIVSVLDDLVTVSENTGDEAAAARYRARRDELNI
jgi:tetratricopeptide (TPR) repeat protein